MRRGVRAGVVLLSASDTLRPVGPAARALGLRWARIEAIRVEPRPRDRLAAELARLGPTDAVVVTSRHAATPTLVRWTRARPAAPPRVFWAAGPGTAERLRRLGVRHVRRGFGVGAEGILRRLGRGGSSVLYVRSDAAGELLGRALRANGHRVTEVVGYRVRPRRAELRRRRATILGAGALVLTSPTALKALRGALGVRTVRALGRATPAVVLGARTARAGRAAGFRRVVVAPTTDPQRFARLLVRTVSDGAA